MGRLGVAIVGCGLVGRKRAQSLGDARLVVCIDTAIDRAKALAALVPEATAESDWTTILRREDVHIVVVATTNDALAPISTAALRAGKHVLVEKPAALSTRELQEVIRAGSQSVSQARVGFNHRYHPAIQKARQIVDSQTIGELMFVRARYGHGGRAGYEKEWRANPATSGGGELIDQGVHLIDLARWFLGDFKKVQGGAYNFYWRMPVDDNAFALLETEHKRVAFLHCSWTEWKNLFSFEIYGKHGKLHIEGLGGSYGQERLAYYQMRPEMGPPDTTIWEYPMIDNSWNLEFAEFLSDIRLNRKPSPTLEDAYAALSVVEQVYAQSSTMDRGVTTGVSR
jgi:predicted dehydrogenase